MKPVRKKALDKMERRRLIARNLFYLGAVMRFITGIIFVLKMILDSNTLTAGLVSIFFMINVLALIVAGRIMQDREKWVYITTLSIAVVSTLLIFVGLPDVLSAISLLVSIFIFINLIPLKAYYYKEA